MLSPDRLSPGQRVRLIHWLDGRLVRGPCGRFVQPLGFFDDKPLLLPVAEVEFDEGLRVPAYFWELEMMT